MDIEISRADLTSPQFTALVARHTQFCDGTAPPDSCHRLEIDALAAPDVTVWQATRSGVLVGMGALKALSDSDGEIKSMHTVAEARGHGVARRLLRVILAEARARNYTGLWLETGVHADFAPARQLYLAHGFTHTAPFGDYVKDPHSLFMTLDLTTAETPA